MVFYAYQRALDAGTGDVTLTGATWAGGSPMAEVVVRCLRTPRGSYLPDGTYGLDYAAAQRARPGAAAAFRAAILDALSRFVRAGRLQNLAVTVTQDGGRLLYDVAFTDPRTDTRGRVTGVL